MAAVKGDYSLNVKIKYNLCVLYQKVALSFKEEKTVVTSTSATSVHPVVMSNAAASISHMLPSRSLS